jgi:hypothetical protein
LKYEYKKLFSDEIKYEEEENKIKQQVLEYWEQKKTSIQIIK